MTTTTQKKYKTGGEIDAYCTKCRLDLNHRIIAMVDAAVKKVECLTCHTHHLYRRPKAERDAANERMANRAEERKTAAAGGSTSSGGSTKSGSKGGHSTKAERDQTATWEHAIAGQPIAAFKAYRITLSFEPGQLVRHSKFGDGVVSRVIDRSKVEVLFKDGPRTMAQGQA